MKILIFLTEITDNTYICYIYLNMQTSNQIDLYRNDPQYCAIRTSLTGRDTGVIGVLFRSMDGTMQYLVQKQDGSIEILDDTGNAICVKTHNEFTDMHFKHANYNPLYNCIFWVTNTQDVIDSFSSDVVSKAYSASLNGVRNSIIRRLMETDPESGGYKRDWIREYYYAIRGGLVPDKCFKLAYHNSIFKLESRHKENGTVFNPSHRLMTHYSDGVIEFNNDLNCKRRNQRQRRKALANRKKREIARKQRHAERDCREREEREKYNKQMRKRQEREDKRRDDRRRREQRDRESERAYLESKRRDEARRIVDKKQRKKRKLETRSPPPYNEQDYKVTRLYSPTAAAANRALGMAAEPSPKRLKQVRWGDLHPVPHRPEPKPAQPRRTSFVDVPDFIAYNKSITRDASANYVDHDAPMTPLNL
jgi:hypothetical protein